MFKNQTIMEFCACFSFLCFLGCILALTCLAPAFDITFQGIK